MSKPKQANQEDLLDDTFGEHSEEEEEQIKQEEPEGKPTPKPEEKKDSDEGEEADEDEGEGEGDVEEEIASFFDSTSEEGEDGDEEDGEGEDGADEEPTTSIDDILNFDEDGFDEITSSPEKFKELLKNVYAEAHKAALADAKKEISASQEQVLQNIPQMVGKAAKRAQSVRQTTQNFFATYPELKEKQGYVKDMTNTVATQNPEWTAAQVLEEVGKRAKRDLNISASAEQREKKRNNPKFAGAGGRRAPGGGEDNRSKQEKLLDDTFGPS